MSWQPLSFELVRLMSAWSLFIKTILSWWSAEGKFELETFCDLRSWWKGVTTIPAKGRHFSWNLSRFLCCIRDNIRARQVLIASHDVIVSHFTPRSFSIFTIRVWCLFFLAKTNVYQAQTHGEFSIFWKRKDIRYQRRDTSGTWQTFGFGKTEWKGSHNT